MDEVVRERLPVEFDLTDETDAAIWLKLRPLIDRKRGTALIRDLLKAYFFPVESGQSFPSAGNPIPQVRRPVGLPASVVAPIRQDDPAADDTAMDNFLDSF
jgi:hypothetical protein